MPVTAALGAVAGILLEVVPPLIRKAETLFKGVTKTKEVNEAKRDSVAQASRAFLTKLQAVGGLDSNPSDEELISMVEAIFQSEKKKLDAENAPKENTKMVVPNPFGYSVVEGQKEPAEGIFVVRGTITRL